jgi:ketosteroid isomerase-like protein
MQATNTRDENQVRDQIERWAKAISERDRPGILAHHSRELLMFDFPAPLVEGIGAYDRTWDFFFANPQGPISFVPHDVRVTAGEDVAFASCLVRCDGTSAGHVDLRLTIGLRKIAGEWSWCMSITPFQLWRRDSSGRHTDRGSAPTSDLHRCEPTTRTGQ